MIAKSLDDNAFGDHIGAGEILCQYIDFGAAIPNEKAQFQPKSLRAKVHLITETKSCRPMIHKPLYGRAFGGHLE